MTLSIRPARFRPQSAPHRTIQLDANAWRMLRRALHARPGEVSFSGIRNWHRREKDAASLRLLCDFGLLVQTTPGPPSHPIEGGFTITDAGVKAADMGEVQVPERAAVDSRKVNRGVPPPPSVPPALPGTPARRSARSLRSGSPSPTTSGRPGSA